MTLDEYELRILDAAFQDDYDPRHPDPLVRAVERIVAAREATVRRNVARTLRSQGHEELAVLIALGEEG